MVTITATRIELNGTISSSGMTGEGYGGAGGSGGSILIQTESLHGHGTITTNGGTGLYSTPRDNYGGGGSGGRIAIYYSSYSFNGPVSSFGGIGYSNGGPGTIFLKNTATGFRKLIVANAGRINAAIGATSFETNQGSVAWLLDENINEFDFEEVLISGGAHVAFGINKLNISSVSLCVLFHILSK